MNIIVLGIDMLMVVSVGLVCGFEVFVSLYYDDFCVYVEQFMFFIYCGCEEVGIVLIDIVDVVIGVGFGFYIGLWVGVVIGRVLVYLVGFILYLVCFFDILVWQWVGVDGEFVVCIDVCCYELYWVCYDVFGYCFDGFNVICFEDLLKDLFIGGLGCLVCGLMLILGLFEYLDVGVFVVLWQVM